MTKQYDDEEGNGPPRDFAIVGGRFVLAFVPREPPRCFSFPAWSALAVRAWANRWDDQISPAAVFLTKEAGRDVPSSFTCFLN